MSLTMPPREASEPGCRAGSAEPSVVVAIVNYRSGQLVVDCLASLAAEIAAVPGTTVVVADNASPDGSGEMIERAIAENGWSGWARVLHLPVNAGFAYGNNAVILESLDQAAAPRYYWLLNPDTIVRPGALEALVRFLDAHPDVGMAGSRLEWPDGTQQCSVFAFHSVLGEFEGSARFGPISRVLARWRVAPPVPQVAGPCGWLAGASILVRREVLRDVGLMDERYFLYYEETDFCLRANRAGWPIWFVPESRVVHLVGQSTGVTNPSDAPSRRPAYWFESRRRYFEKNHGKAYAVMADAALAMGTGVWRLRCWLEKRPSGCPARFLTV
jgi:N-acetylglucosaminyl-diphospho-decaprenol L-rhamnosyltransferase